jgi:ubiquinone/menaquinone biosynthesis C-methylase UbiE
LYHAQCEVARFAKEYYAKTYRLGEISDQPIICALVDDMLPCSVLEVGPGWGTLATYLASHDCQVTVMDCAEQDVYMPTGLCEKYRIEYVHQDVSEKALDRKFDLVVCSEVLLHLEHRPDRAVRHIGRMTGQLAVVVVPANEPRPMAYKTWRDLPEYGQPVPMTHYNRMKFTDDEFRDLLSGAFGSVEIIKPRWSPDKFGICRP